MSVRLDVDPRFGLAQASYNHAHMRRATETDPITMDELRSLAAGRFGDMVKAVVDLKRGVMLLDADMHADQEAELLSEGAAQREFDSMINLRPSSGNRSRGVDDPTTRNVITDLVARLVRR